MAAMRFVVPAVLVGLLLSVAGTARAQHHHHHHDGGGDEGEGEADSNAIEGHAGITIESGRVRAFAGERDYQGLSFMAGARRGVFEAMLHVPLYRMAFDNNTTYGLGDAHLMGRWIAYSRGSLDAGIGAGVMPPWGDDEDGLGMGHWMIMAGGFARASRGPLSGEVSLGYGGAPGGGGHAEHGVPVWPAVNPMNAHQIDGKLQLSIALWNQLGASLATAAAAPLGEGVFIMTAGGGLTYQLGRYTVGASARHGLAEHTAELVVSADVMAGF